MYFYRHASIHLSLIVITLFSSFTIAQTECPTISVNGPAGIVPTGETANYIVTINPLPERQLNVQYLWTTSAGTIIGGQGTTAIEVRQPDQTFAVTVEVTGLPQGCPNEASLMLACREPLPEAVKIGLFDKSMKNEAPRLEEVIREMNDNPNNQLYTIFAYQGSPAGAPARKREQQIIDYLAPKIGGQDRITRVRYTDSVDLVEFWRVPPGAENPKCDECKELEKRSKQCPTITVTGPAGITMPGDLMTFRAELTGEVPNNVGYHWRIKNGEIIDGQGTLEIRGKYATTVGTNTF